MSTITPSNRGPVGDAQVQSYGEAVGDFNPVHFDPEFAKAAGLPDTVVHGPLTVALILDAIVAQLGPDAILNLDTRLRAPVFKGDELTVTPTDYGVSVAKANGDVVATAVLIVEADR